MFEKISFDLEILIKSQLKWCGHFIYVEDDHIQKQILDKFLLHHLVRSRDLL